MPTYVMFCAVRVAGCCSVIVNFQTSFHSRNKCECVLCWCCKQKMLVYDPPQRISAIGAMHHPYFADLDLDSLPAK